ncbi:MAG: hypothetical protein M4579_004163 [Chaenotheca gracillima]|nr:MAG: hypothetical protein M4579_004163 [Chaenotheca gracillima]
MSSLTEIAEAILANAKSLDQYTSSQGLPSPSFDCDTLGILPEEVEAKRKALIDDTQTLKRLALGPTGLYHEILSQFTDLLSLRAIYCYDLAKPVPVEGEASYEEIAQASHLDLGHTRRFLKHAMTNRLFKETEEGMVRHTVASRMLVEDPTLYDFVGLLTDDFHAASIKVIESMKKYPGSEEPNETGFNVEYNTSSPLYVELAKDPERMRRFRSGMSFSLRDQGLDLRYLVQGFDWAEIDKPGNTVVDVGGGHGDVTRALVTSTTSLKLVLQDLPGTIKEAETLFPKDLKHRVTFMPHDFFSPQPVIGASVYFFRWILHDWSDKYCVKILQSLIPGMKDGSKVLLYEYLLPEMAHLPWSYKMVRNLDMMMKVCWNARLRSVADWQEIFARAHPAYQFQGVKRPEGGSMFLIEAVFRPASVSNGASVPPEEAVFKPASVSNVASVPDTKEVSRLGIKDGLADVFGSGTNGLVATNGTSTADGASSANYESLKTLASVEHVVSITEGGAVVDMNGSNHA